MDNRTTILVLAASPLSQVHLRLDEEVREIGYALQLSRARDNFRLEQRWAVRAIDLQQAMHDVRPQIVHFCGHGTSGGLVFEDGSAGDHFVSADAIADLFRLYSGDLECVLLNACYSDSQAEAIAQYVPYVIGMSQEIGDPAAISYSKGFYAALGAGRTIREAHEFGRNAIHLQESSSHLAPVLQEMGKKENFRRLDEFIAGTDYSVLRKATQAQISRLLDYHRTEIRRDPLRVLSHYSLGLLFLHIKTYDAALSSFLEAARLSPEVADIHYYCGVTVNRGRRLKVLPPAEISSIELHLDRATGLDSMPAKYYYYKAMISYDYYFGNSIRAPLPRYDELFRIAHSKEQDYWETERLLSLVPVPESEMLLLIRKGRVGPN
ncbi:MAG TPA: CHAT domain-containing protein [Thermoanaerobaculia bacterium]|jgi:tetratricopeptide (TPR) repeat protein|nr:CHAT domain-containing protein [Thermoanaerobaculia bacterium]